MSYASNGEEDNESFSSSLFFIPPTHDGLLQTLRFATASVKGGATSYTVWEEEVDGDDNEVKASSSKTFLFCFVLRYIFVFLLIPCGFVVLLLLICNENLCCKNQIF